jgi:hypothetical protein
MAGCDCGKVMGWTKYLFSDGFDGHKAQQEKKAYIDKCEAKLDELVENTLKQTSMKHEKRNDLKLSRRIAVTNIAADAGVYDLAVVFHEYEM